MGTKKFIIIIVQIPGVPLVVSGGFNFHISCVASPHAVTLWNSYRTLERNVTLRGHILAAGWLENQRQWTSVGRLANLPSNSTALLHSQPSHAMPCHAKPCHARTHLHRSICMLYNRWLTQLYKVSRIWFKRILLVTSKVEWTPWWHIAVRAVHIVLKPHSHHL